MPTDRQRVEASIPAFLMFDVALSGLDESEGEQVKNLRTYLAIASTECVQDLQEPSRSKILRRSQRIFHEVFDEYRKENMDVAKLGLMAYYLLKAVTDVDYLVIGPESMMQKALDILLPVLGEHAEVQKLDRSAQKQARRVLQRLQGFGYYPGVPLPDDT